MSSWLLCYLEPTLVGSLDCFRGFLAYLDPGMGSYALQIFLASLFGGMFALKQSWAEIKGWYQARVASRASRADRSRGRQGYDTLLDETARPRAHGRSIV